jgi:hypothetical protein
LVPGKRRDRCWRPLAAAVCHAAGGPVPKAPNSQNKETKTQSQEQPGHRPGDKDRRQRSISDLLLGDENGYQMSSVLYDDVGANT